MHAPVLPPDEAACPCPGCAGGMTLWPLDPQLSGAGYRGSDPLIYGCRRCGGAWVDRRTLTALIDAAELPGTVDPRRVPRQTMAMAEIVTYRPCPRCKVRMHRRNFGRYSGIVVDDCSSCGTFFEAGKLAGVIAFVRAGGLTLARQRDAEEAQREQARREQGRTSGTRWSMPSEARLGRRRGLGRVLLERWLRRLVE